MDISKFEKIREMKGLTHQDIGNLMGLDAEIICNIERGHINLTRDLLDNYKAIMGMESVPLSCTEVAQYDKVLEDWKNLILVGDMEKAGELQPLLSRNVKWSLEPGLQLTYDLYFLEYLRTIGNMDTFKALLTSVQDRRDSLTKENNYWYTRALGYRHLAEWQYRDALIVFLSARDKYETLNIRDESVLHNIGYCLTFMGYSYIARETLEEAQRESSKKYNSRYNLTIQMLNAAIFKNLGNHSKSLELLEACLRDVKEKKHTDMFEGVIYRNLAEIYQTMGCLNEAEAHINKAFEYFEAGSESYVYYLYIKASILADWGKFDEYNECLEKGLSFSPSDDTFNGLLLKSLKNSLTLDNDDSVKYMEECAIPKLLLRGLNLQAINYCTKLSRHFESSKKYKRAFLYSEHANRVKDKLMKGDYSL